MTVFKRPLHQPAQQHALTDPVLKALYEDLEEEYQVLGELLKTRVHAGKTQTEVAQLMGTKTSFVGRLESPAFHRKHSPTLLTLRRYARALGCKVEVRFIPKDVEESCVSSHLKK